MHMHSDVGRDFVNRIYVNARLAGARKVAQQKLLYCSRLLCGARRTQTRYRSMLTMIRRRNTSFQCVYF